MVGHLEGLTPEQILDIEGTIQEYCNIPVEGIKNFYGSWKKHTRKTGNPNGYFENGFHPFNPIKDKMTHNFDGQLVIAENARHFGIDLPYWFDWENSKKTKVLVVGINPIRNEGDFGRDQNDKALINSGWGAHNEFMYDTDYRDFFETIHEKCSLFLTDYQKLYFTWDKGEIKKNGKINTLNSHSYPKFKDKKMTPVHKKILDKEIDIIKPDIIICFGQIPASGLGIINKKIAKSNIQDQKNSYLGCRFYQFPHIAYLQRGLDIPKIFFEKNNVPENNDSVGQKLGYLLNRIVTQKI